MSGAFGWHRNDQHDHTGGTQAYRPSGYQDAKQAYGFDSRSQTTQTKAQRITIGASAPAAAAAARDLSQLAHTAKLPTPDARHTLKSTAANVIIVITDVTASMRKWPQEIFKRLPLLYVSATDYLGTDDLEILFIAHGDARSDQHPIQVARFGRGPELDQHLASFYTDCGGGGQGSESQELVAYYLATRVDTSSARNVFGFFITDEAACDAVDPRHVREHLGTTLDQRLANTKTVFAELRHRMHLYTILRKAECYNPQPIKAWWDSRLGGEFVLPLSDARRVADVILGTIASLTGQRGKFVQDLTGRQSPTRYGAQNVDTVMHSIAMIGKGTPSSPFRLPGGGGPPALLPPNDGGTKSLLD